MLAVVGIAFAAGALTDSGLRARLDWRIAGPAEAGSHENAENVNGAGTARADDGTGTAKSDEGVGASFRRPDDPATAVATTGVVAESPIDGLRRRGLKVPVDGIRPSDLHDTFTDAREGGVRAHEALDIMAARRTPVRAVEDGTIEKLFTSRAGGLTIYQFEPSKTFCYYYAHLDGYAEGLHEGQEVKKGDLLGYVGSTGNASADAPHLHFAIFRLTPERQWWKGEPIDPYLVLR